MSSSLCDKDIRSESNVVTGSSVPGAAEPKVFSLFNVRCVNLLNISLFNFS